MKSIYNAKIGYKTLVWHRYAKKKQKQEIHFKKCAKGKILEIHQDSNILVCG